MVIDILRAFPKEAIETAEKMMQSMTLDERNMYSDAMLRSNDETTKLRIAVRKKLSESFDVTNYSVTCHNCRTTTQVNLAQMFMGLMEFSSDEINAKRRANGNFNKVDRPEKTHIASGLSVLLDVYCCGKGRQTALDAHDVAMHVVRNMDFTPEYVETKRTAQIVDSNIPDNLFHCTLQNFKVNTERMATVMGIVKVWLQDTLKGGRSGLILTGESRTGKTHLSVALLHELLTEGKSVRFMSYPEWSDKLFNRTYKEFVAECERVDVLLIDDFAHGKPSDEMKTAVLNMLEQRAVKITIFTSNFQGKAIKTRFGDPIMNRLLTHCKTVAKFNGVKPWEVAR